MCLGDGRRCVEETGREAEGCEEGAERYLRVQTFEQGGDIAEERAVEGCIPGPMAGSWEGNEGRTSRGDAFHWSTRADSLGGSIQKKQGADSSGGTQRGAVQRAIGGEA